MLETKETKKNGEEEFTEAITKADRRRFGLDFFEISVSESIYDGM
jgi:hypothetical protein